MKTGKNKSTNNVIVRFWNKSYYEEKRGTKEKWKTMYTGTITGVKSKKDVFFHSPAQFLSKLEKMLKVEEKAP